MHVLHVCKNMEWILQWFFVGYHLYMYYFCSISFITAFQLYVFLSYSTWTISRASRGKKTYSVNTHANKKHFPSPIISTRHVYYFALYQCISLVCVQIVSAPLYFQSISLSCSQLYFLYISNNAMQSQQYDLCFGSKYIIILFCDWLLIIR